jgi:8-oxo-dGTP diphosphatase
MAIRDGDGWVDCRCGGKHWGLNGAAGLMLLRERSILMQHRADWVHNGNTWGLPGGARDSHEDAIAAAIREAVEETGINGELVKPLNIFTDDHLDWRYDTVLAKADPNLELGDWNQETKDMAWVPIENVDKLPLHPSFARTWPAIYQLIVANFL